MELADKVYVERCRDGHTEDFSLLVGRYQRPLFAFLARRLGDHREAEEAAQESFVRAFLGLRGLRRPEMFHTWLIGIAARVLKERFRSRQRRERDRAAAQDWAENAPESEPDYPLEEAVAGLPESHRQVILLRYFEGLSCQEIATRLEMPLGTVTKTLSRAYALLRQELQARAGVELAQEQKETR
jgi:RNA polymerase sigma-70 factor (ECF subfamily)